MVACLTAKYRPTRQHERRLVTSDVPAPFRFVPFPSLAQIQWLSLLSSPPPQGLQYLLGRVVFAHLVVDEDRQVRAGVEAVRPADQPRDRMLPEADLLNRLSCAGMPFRFLPIANISNEV